MVVPKHIDNTEDCIRCVMHPNMYSSSKKRLKEPAVLPPPNDNKVSLLRLKYTSGGIEFCKNHGLSLENERSVFVGLAKIRQNDVLDCNDASTVEHPQDPVLAQIVYAPMSGGKYLPCNVEVDTTDSNIDMPMHADLTYNIVNNNEGEVKTSLRMYAKELIKKIEFAQYCEGDIDEWTKL